MRPGKVNKSVKSPEQLLLRSMQAGQCGLAGLKELMQAFVQDLLQERVDASNCMKHLARLSNFLLAGLSAGRCGR